MKKRIFTALLAVLMVVMLLPVQAMATTLAPSTSTAAPAGSEVVKGAYVNQNFDTVIDTVMGAKSFSRSGTLPPGLKLSGSWSYKNTYGDYVFKMTLSGKPTQAGTYNFAVNYIKEDGKTVEKTVNYTITVGEKAPFVYCHSISVEKWPTKTTYYLGDTVNLSGMKVVATVYVISDREGYLEPVEIDVTELCWVEPEVFTSDEAQNVKVFFRAPSDQNGTLTTFEDHFRVDFKYANPNDVTRIEVYQKPTKLTYTVGEKLDTAGMTVRLHKGNGSAEDITTGFTVEEVKLDAAGTKTVTVKYTQNNNEFTATFDVTVEEKPVESSSSSSASSSQTSSAPESSVPEESEPAPETSESVPESSESVPEPVEQPESSESSEESQSVIEVIENPEVPEEEDKGGIPFWAWIIIALLVVLIGAAVALFIIGRKRIDEE